jgi:hypothetical protein
MEATETKWCPRGKHTIPVEMFGRNIARRDGLDSMCKECKKNRAIEMGLQSRKMAARRARHKVIVDEAKLIGCQGCGESDPIVLEFHHRVPRLGNRNVVTRMLGLSADRVREEIAGCQVLCANCHKKVEAGTLFILEDPPC